MNEVGVILNLALLGVALAVLGVMAVYGIFSLVSAVSFVTYVPSGKAKSLAMLKLAGVGEGSRVIDLGSGDGLLCLMASRCGATSIGIEINPVLVAVSKVRARLWKVDDRCSFVFADMWKHELPRKIDVVFVYGWPDRMGKLWVKLQNDLPSGTKIVSHAFCFPGIQPVIESDNVRLYRI